MTCRIRGEHTNNESQDALNDEDPGPTTFASNTFHGGNGSRQETTERASRRSRREEDSHAETTFMASVPHGDIVRNTREQTTLRKTQQRSRGQQSSVVRHETHTSSDDSPGDHDGWDPERRLPVLHHHVGGNFGDDIGGEEDHEGDVVVEALHAEGGFETGETSISDVRTVEEGEAILVLVLKRASAKLNA